MATRRAKLHLAAFWLFAVLAGALLTCATASAASAKPTGQEMEEALTCQCGCGLTVANCNHPNCEFSVPVREQIEGMLRHGMGRPQIIAYFRDKYGEKILSAPTTQGFNLLAWTTPFMALAAGGALIVFTVGRWHQGQPKRTNAPAADEVAVIDPELKRRLERELRERL